MMTLVIFPMGDNSNIDDQILMIEGGEGGGVKKSYFRDDIICERSLKESGWTAECYHIESCFNYSDLFLETNLTFT